MKVNVEIRGTEVKLSCGKKNFQMTYNSDFMDKDLFINMLLMNVVSMGGKTMVLFVQDGNYYDIEEIKLGITEAEEIATYNAVDAMIEVRGGMICLS